MKRQEFLSELSICLLSLPDDIRKEICGDFNDHFIEGAERGLTEEEICRNLGQPSAIAEQFAEEYKSSGKDAGSPENRTFEINIPEITIPEISIPEIKIPEINIALTGSDSPRENRRNAPGSGEGDWNEPPVSVSVFDKNQFEIDIFKTFTQVGGIKVDLKNSNLTLRPVSQSESVTVKIKGLARHDRFAAENIDGKLHIIENAVRSPFDFFLNRKVKLDTVVTVPMGFCGDMEISVNNGTTDLSGICGSELRAKNNMKNITLDGCRFDRFDIQASFGNVIFLNCVAAEAKLRASAGEMRVSGCDCALDAHCSAGNLHVSG
ncbi:MAG: DUF1700 domain-containing protein, partial [Defluviitaleaceae bacterium]|nr:DUF1700 domain-containing protein [Defluviitaleaceae bacterium]